MSSKKQTWLALSSGKPPSFTIEAWHPNDFVWNIHSLHKNIPQLKRLKIVLGLHPGSQTGMHPELLFDQLPLPLLSGDSYVSETLGPHLECFAMIPLKTGTVISERFVKWGTSLLPVPTPQVMYTDIAQIPQTRHFAIVNGHFCITKSLASKNSFFFRCVEFKPLSKTFARQEAKSRDYSNLFANPTNETLVSFQNKFNAWLDDALCQKIPTSVVAFSFNLAEPWCIEIIGSDRYSEDDPEWACEESFRPDREQLALPASVVGKSWKVVMKSAKQMIAAYLDRPSAGSAILRRAEAVVVGFVDGDLERVWPRR